MVDLDTIFDDSRTPGVMPTEPARDGGERGVPAVTPLRSACANGISSSGVSADAPNTPHGSANQTDHELSLDERVAIGYANPGWRPAQWAARLLQLASACESLRPDLAAKYRRWAANVLLKGAGQ